MGISGEYVKSFDDANLAFVADVHLNADYPHFYFDVVEVTPDEVKLKSHKSGEILTFKRKHKKAKIEFLDIEMSSFWERFISKKPGKFQIFGMKGEKI